MQANAYRNSEVYALDAHLSGAITQVLYLQNILRNNWLLHQSSTLLQGKQPDTTKCVVIAGITPVEQAKLRSFEVFRNACKDVDVVTFDELLSKLQLLLEHLSPKAVEPARNLFKARHFQLDLDVFNCHAPDPGNGGLTSRPPS